MTKNNQNKLQGIDYRVGQKGKLRSEFQFCSRIFPKWVTSSSKICIFGTEFSNIRTFSNKKLPHPCHDSIDLHCDVLYYTAVLRPHCRIIGRIIGLARVYPSVSLSHPNGLLTEKQKSVESPNLSSVFLVAR